MKWLRSIVLLAFAPMLFLYRRDLNRFHQIRHDDPILPLVIIPDGGGGDYHKNQQFGNRSDDAVTLDTLQQQDGPLVVAREGNVKNTTTTATTIRKTTKKAQGSSSAGGGAFIHVGKTGGSTLTRFLRNACHSFLPKPCGGVIPKNESLVSKLISDYYHVPDFFKLPRKNHTFYLISMRDPFERTVSGFVTGHPRNAKALGLVNNPNWKRKQRGGYFQPTCFDTLEQFVENIGDPPTTDFYYPYRSREVRQENCTDFARAMIHAKIQRMDHLFYNYQKLKSLLPAAPAPPSSSSSSSSLDDFTIYATRKDHLFEDFAKINQLLARDTTMTSTTTTAPTTTNVLARETTHVRDISKLTLPVTRDLSDRGRQRLCRALEQEYLVYMEFLLHARNLNGEDIRKDLAHSRAQCPDLEILSEAYWKERLE